MNGSRMGNPAGRLLTFACGGVVHNARIWKPGTFANRVLVRFQSASKLFEI